MLGTVGLETEVRGRTPLTIIRLHGPFTLGAMLGGAILGSAVAVLATGLRWVGVPWQIMQLGVVGVSALTVLEGVQQAPSACHLKRQVDRMNIERLPVPIASAFWGLQLGLGVFTRVNSWLFWLLVSVIALIGDLSAGLFVGLVYGLARALQLTLTALAGSPTSVALTQSVRRCVERSRVTFVVGLSILLAFASQLVRGGVGP